jgi:hypothetical protein
MSLVHQLLDVTASGDVNSAVIYTQGHLDESGLYQVSNASGNITNVHFYGRLGADHSWHLVASSGSITGAGTKLATLAIYPQMYVELDTSTASTCVISIME